MRVVGVLTIALMALLSAQTPGLAQDDDLEKLKKEIEVLQLKLQLAEKTAEVLEKECEELRSEVARLKGDDSKAKAKEADKQDQFSVGSVWVGTSKATNNPKVTTRWAISVSERDGQKFSGGLAIIGPDGKKVDVPFSGTAPVSGDGVVVIETATIGRAKIFCRGRLVNGEAALAFSGTNPLGERIFGSATMKPQ